MRQPRIQTPSRLHTPRQMLVARLRGRAEEVESALFAHASAELERAAARTDETYGRGLREEVKAIVADALACLEHGDEDARAVPAELTEQARAAAAGRLGLTFVLVRCAAEHELINDVLTRESTGVTSDKLAEVLHARRQRLERTMQLGSRVDVSRLLASLARRLGGSAGLGTGCGAREDPNLPSEGPVPELARP
jgi:hypothetical protein